MAGKFKLVEAFAELTARDGKFRAALTRVHASMVKVQAKMNAVAATSTRMFLVGGLAMAGLVRTAAKFEQSMARVRAITGASNDQFERLKNTAKKMGEETVFSASQAAEAMGNMAQDGQKTEEIIRGIPHVLNLAAGAQIELGQAATIVAGVMGTMGLETSELAEAVDILTAASNNSRANIPRLGHEMSKLGSSAKLAGIPLSEAIAILEVLSTGMETGQGRAGRALLGALAKNGKEVQKVFSDVGVEIRDSATNQIRPLADIVDDFNKSLKDQGRETDALGLSMNAFGKNGGAAFGLMLDKGGDVIRAFKKINDESEGMGKAMASIQLDTFTGLLKLLLSKLEAVAITIGTMMMPAFERMIAGIDQLLGWFQSLSSAQLQQIKTWTIFGFSMLGVLILMPKLMLALRGILLVIKFMIAPAITLAGALGGVALVLGVLAAVWITAKANGESFTKTLNDMAAQAGMTTLELLGLGNAIEGIDDPEREKDIGRTVGEAEKAVAKAEGLVDRGIKERKETPEEKAQTKAESAIGKVQNLLNRVRDDLEDARKELRKENAKRRGADAGWSEGFVNAGNDIKRGFGKIIGLDDPVNVLSDKVGGLKQTEENLVRTIDNLRGRLELSKEGAPSSLDAANAEAANKAALRIGGGEAVSAAQLQSRIQALTQSKAEAQREEMIDNLEPMNNGVQELAGMAAGEGIKIQGDVVGVFGAK